MDYYCDRCGDITDESEDWYSHYGDFICEDCFEKVVASEYRVSENDFINGTYESNRMKYECRR